MTTKAVVGGMGPQAQGRLEAAGAGAGGTLPQSFQKERRAHTLISDLWPEVGGNPFVVCGHLSQQPQDTCTAPDKC